MTGRRHEGAAWLALFRLPNLLTLPGDVLAGALLATGGVLHAPLITGAVISASFCLYGAGLVFNDWVDLEEDRRARPDRPIPSGAVPPRNALRMGFVLLAAGILLPLLAGIAASICAILLAGAVLAYNFLTKRQRLAAALNMGLCRGLNLSLGAAAATAVSPIDTPPSLLIWAACLVTVYIAAVTWLAHKETEGGYRSWEGWLPAAVSVIGLAAYFTISTPAHLLQWAVFALSWVAFLTVCIGASVRFSLAAGTNVSSIPPLIGKWIGALIPLQSALIVASGPTPPNVALGAAVFCLWPLQRRLARWFYSS